MCPTAPRDVFGMRPSEARKNGWERSAIGPWSRWEKPCMRRTMGTAAAP
jgi:hypothetical protein